MIVELDETAERVEAVTVRVIRAGVGPLVDQGLDEPLGFAITQANLKETEARMWGAVVAKKRK